MKKIKINKLDSIFSKCVRERDDWQCQRCGSRPSPQGLDCSHIYGRARYSVRWHPLNAKALCVGCHRWWHSFPTESTAWIKDYLGAEKYDELKWLERRLVRFRAKDKKEMYDHFKSELERMQELRDRGECGRIEFDAWEMP